MDAIFAVVNPGGRDASQVFADGAGSPAAAGHAPINYHAYAACFRSGFYRNVAEVPEGVRAALVLLRKNGLKDARAALTALRKRKIAPWISWKESGLHQVSDALSDPRRLQLFREICTEAEGFLSSTPELEALYQSNGCARGDFIPTPYPVDASPWDFSAPIDARRGVFIGTREFNVTSRHHLLAITAACSLGQPVTVLNPDGRKEEKLLRAISEKITIVPKRLPYVEYLRLMAGHRLVFQLDRSAVPGQVAGDALLAGNLCVGGDGAVERLAYPALCGSGRTTGELLATARRLLEDDVFYQAEIDGSRARARATLSFPAIRSRIESLLAGA